MKELYRKETICISIKVEYDSEKEMQLDRMLKFISGWKVNMTKECKNDRFIVGYISYRDYSPRSGG